MFRLLCALIILISLHVTSLASGDPLKDLVVRDHSDYVEINHVYSLNKDGVFKKRMVQIIWWEWKDPVLLPVKDKLGFPTGDWKSGADFVVKSFKVTSNGTLPDGQLIVQRAIYPRRFGKKWICSFYDNDDDVLREVVSRWVITTHTSHDTEIENRKILSINNRTGLTKLNRKR